MGKFDDLTLDDLPEIATRLGELKYETGDNRRFHAAVLAFLVQVDKAVADWEFTAQLFLHIQGLFDSLEKFYEDNYGHQTTQGFLRALSRLDSLDTEGERARKHLANFGSIADEARHFVITEEG